MNDPRPARRGDRIRLTDPLHTFEVRGQKAEGMLNRPRALRPGGTIAVVAPAGPSDRSRIEEAAAKIEGRGYRVVIAANVNHQYNEYLAGDDDERAAELNHYLRSADCDAIF